MTRRERRIKLISRFADQQRRYEFEKLIAVHGTSVLSDEGLRLLAKALIHGDRFARKIHEQNRKLRRAS